MKKVTYILYLFTALGVLYAANRLDKDHFETAQHSLNSIYKDRVVAQNIIYRLSSKFNERLLSYHSDTSKHKLTSNFKQQDLEINKLFDQFRETKLTEEENKHFTALEKSYSKLILQEKEMKASSSIDFESIEKTFIMINQKLDELSEIQLSESNNLKAIGQKSLDSNMLMSMTEIALMILLVIVILFFIFNKGFK